MKRILIIRDKTLSFTGGIKKHCDELKELMECYKDIEILPIEDLPCKYVKLIRKFRYNSNSLRQYIINSKCDIVHVHGFMSLGVIQAINTAYNLNKEIIYSPHFHPFQYLQNPIYGKLFFYSFIKPILYKVKTIVTINKEDTLFFKKYHHNVINIPHWNTHVENNVPSTNSKLPNSLLFVGRNDSNKGLEHLYQLPSQYKVHCVTKGPLLRDDFILHQNISDTELNKLYEQVSVVVIPSRYEAFSLVALEALSHHTPIVISDRVRIGDYLTGEKGYKIFKYHDYLSFNKSIKDILQQKDIDYKQLLSPFDVNKIKKIYYKLYTENNINSHEQ